MVKLQLNGDTTLASEDKRRIVVLLVDDQAMVGEGIRRMLATEKNIDFHYCQDPAKALQMAIDIDATVILQDLMMPDVEGMTLMRFYKNHPQTKDIPVIVLSSKEDAEVKSDAFSNGADDYLVKMPDAIELIARIRAHSTHHLMVIERAAAYQILQGMQQQLEQANIELEKSNQELERLSCLDGLTGIANRRSFDNFLEKAWRHAVRGGTGMEISVIMLDIDYFKPYNDNYGHQGGDDCLKQVAVTLEKCAQRGADLLARYGGEEFIAVLVDTPTQGAVTVAEDMQNCISKLALPHTYSKLDKTVTLSMGIATLTPGANNNLKQLVKAADRALYQAKEGGRNRFVVAGAEKTTSKKKPVAKKKRTAKKKC